MSRILKRPMFRIGGSANDGVMSMAAPRRNYQQGSPREERITRSAEEYARLLEKFAGPGPSTSSDLGDLLISGGLNLMSGRGAGKGNLGAIAEAYRDPYAAFSKARANEEALKRQLRMSAATQAISSDEARELQKMKVEAAQAEARQKAEQVDKELFLKTSGLGTNAGSIYDTKRTLERKGEVVVGAIPTVGSGEKVKPTPTAILSIPEGRVFYDVNGNFYRRVKEGQGWKRITLSGEEIKVEAPVKKPGFFDSPGAAYDPRSWNKQKFYESLAKKNPPSTME